MYEDISILNAKHCYVLLCASSKPFLHNGNNNKKGTFILAEKCPSLQADAF